MEPSLARGQSSTHARHQACWQRRFHHCTPYHFNGWEAALQGSCLKEPLGKSCPTFCSERTVRLLLTALITKSFPNPGQVYTTCCSSHCAYPHHVVGVRTHSLTALQPWRSGLQKHLLRCHCSGASHYGCCLAGLDPLYECFFGWHGEGMCINLCQSQASRQS